MCVCLGEDDGTQCCTMLVVILLFKQLEDQDSLSALEHSRHMRAAGIVSKRMQGTLWII